MGKIVLKTGEVIELELEEALKFIKEHSDLIEPQHRKMPPRRAVIKG